MNLVELWKKISEALRDWRKGYGSDEQAMQTIIATISGYMADYRAEQARKEEAKAKAEAERPVTEARKAALQRQAEFRERRFSMLRAYEAGLTKTEIARIFGVSVTNVTRLMERAKREREIQAKEKGND